MGRPMGGGVHPARAVVALALAVLLVVTIRVAPPALAGTAHAPVRIAGNAGFTPANGVTGGSGTPSDPYVIEGWDIDASTAAGVEVVDTDAPFVLRNLTVRQGGSVNAGVHFVNVTNARAENVTANLSAPGFLVEGSRNVTISSCTATGNDVGVEVTGSAGVTVERTESSYNSLLGVRVEHSDLVNVSDNTLTDNAYAVGAWTFSGPSSRVTISGNVARSTYGAVTADGVTGLAIRSNVLTGGNGVSVAGAIGVEIAGNVFDGGGGGPGVWDSENVAIVGNNVSGGASWGVFVEASANVTVQGNTLSGNAHGLGLRSDTGVTLGGNRITGSGIMIDDPRLQAYRDLNATPDNVVNGRPFVFGKGCSDLTLDGPDVAAQVVLVDCQRVRLSRLQFTGVEMGVVLANVRDAVLASSAFSDNRGPYNVLVTGGDGITVQDNNVTGGDGYGLRMGDATNVTVVRNTFEHGSAAVRLDAVANATFYHNNFIHNGDPATDFGPAANRWDAGYPAGGNYWSGYRGPDACSGPDQNVCTGGDGIGDVPVGIWRQGSDRYPLIRPRGRPALPPAANFSFSPDSPLVGASVSFNGWSSSDPDGTIVSYTWLFGDGATALATAYPTHAYTEVGSFTVTLTVTDNSGLANATTRTLLIAPPPDYPEVSIRGTTPPPYYVGMTLTFEGMAWTHSGFIASFLWDLGDGTTGTAPIVDHVYAAPGPYTIDLNVTNSWGHSTHEAVRIDVEAAPQISLTMYSHPSGFRIPFPSDWHVVQDAEIADPPFAYAAYGPDHGFFRTNILVDTGSDSTVREDQGYLDGLVHDTLAALQADSPDTSLQGDPEYRTISGHSGVVFTFVTPHDHITQTAAVVVSEAHGRYWFILLSVSTPAASLYDDMFGRIVAGFEITAMPTASVLGIIAAVVGGAAAAIVVGALVVLRRGKRALAAQPRTVAPRSIRCAACGHEGASVDRYCQECGRPLVPPAPPPPPST